MSRYEEILRRFEQNLEVPMTWEYVAFAVAALMVILMIIFRKNPIVKKYWKYGLIFIPLIFLIILRIINKRKVPSTGESNKDPLRSKIEDLKDSLQEVNLEAAVEVSAAKEKNKQMIERLKEIKKIPEKKERIRRLADLVG